MKRWAYKVLFGLFMIVLFSFCFVVKNNYYVYLASVLGIYIVLALGLNLLFGFTGQISLGHAGFFALGAYGAGLLEINFGTDPLLATVVSVAGTAVLAYCIGFPILRMTGHYLAVGTLAFGLIINIVALNWNSVTRGVNGIYIPSTKVFGYMLMNSDFYLLIMIMVVVSYYICHQISESRVGRAMKAIREDEIAAKVCGIDIIKYKVLAFSISAGLAATAGSVYGHLNKTISPYYFDLDASITILVMIIVGGLGSNLGAVIGAIFIKLLPEFLAKYEEYHLVIYGVLLLFVLVFAPKGILGFFVQGKARLKRLVFLRRSEEKDRGEYSLRSP